MEYDSEEDLFWLLTLTFFCWSLHLMPIAYNPVNRTSLRYPQGTCQILESCAILVKLDNCRCAMLVMLGDSHLHFESIGV
jgi:hypothetical protein